MKKKNSNVFLTVLLVVMSSYPPLSTDMYLPSLAEIAKEFDATDSLINLTLVLFFIFFSISTLMWGPISDKFGRKPSLLTGITLYTIASLGCFLSQSAFQLIVLRIIQAIGAGAPVTISIAIVQDLYTGEHKKKILSVLSALMMVAPVVAPILGSFILSVSTWRTNFILLFLIGFLSLAGCFFIPETNKFPSKKSVIKSFSGIFTVMKAPFFRKAVFIFSAPALIVLGFVGGSSAILRSSFGVSGTTFTFYFALNACFAIIGSLLYVPVSRHFKANSLVVFTFLVALICGELILLFGNLSAGMFMLLVIPTTLFTALIRPLGMNLMMDESGNDAGSASAVINFLFTVLGSISMEIISFNWHDRTSIFAVLTMLAGIIGLLGWNMLKQASAKVLVK